MLPINFPIALLLLFCITAAQVSVAQNPKKKPKSDVEVINFGDNDDSKKEKDKTYKGIILKTSPTTFIFGRQPFEVEKQITDYLSLQIGAGIVFEPLWAGYEELLSELNSEFQEDYSSPLWDQDVLDDYSDFNIRSGKVGPMFSVSPRLFFESDGYEGMYIAPVLRYSIQRYDVQKVREGIGEIEYLPKDLQQESVKNMDLLVHWGGQTLYPKLTLEWFIGGGIRLRNNTRQDVGFSNTTLSGNGERQFNDKRLRLETGIRVGFQL